MSKAGTRSLGLAAILGATVLWSTTGLFVRLAGLDGWSIVLWRSVFAALALAIYWPLAVRERGAALRATFSGAGVATVLLGVLGSATYIVALTLTSVATVMTVYAALPFVSGALAFLATGERLTRRFGAAGLLAVIGIAVMCGAAVGPNDLFGILLSLLMTVSYAGMLVLAKKHPSLDTTLLSLGSALGCIVVALPLVPHEWPATGSLVACALLGTLTSGLASVLTLIGGRHIGSGEAGFLLLLDVALAPLWVWALLGETVTLPVLAGGGLVVAAVLWYLAGDSFRRAPAEPRPCGPG
ncbi:DMT family transporter [Ancylobacter lacus]|uniref:DMT family transporter n=1 Tax=Ancylobacter lacus TaxID=2579970 RepID=UPI001BD15DA3|nr:DMT family transporter [Ancylobacter lacus]MBS7539240.1 DMT family transporter [Ancylobacter lacus]